MQTQAMKNPVTAIQELMAAHATRAEGYETLQGQATDASLKSDFAGKAAASRRCNEELMKELSQFGDAAQSEVNRDNEVQRVWTDIASGNPSSTGNLPGMLGKAELALAALYGQILENTTGLPESLESLLKRQKTSLSATGSH